MLNKLLLLLFTSLVLSYGEVHAQSPFNLQPSGSNRVVDCSLNTTYCSGQYTRGTWWDLYNTQTTRSDSSAPISPPTVAYARLNYSGTCVSSPPGQVQLPCAIGGIHLEWFDNQTNNDEMYFGLIFKLNSTYTCSLVGLSKMFFMRMLDNPTSATHQSNGVFLIRGCDTQNRSIVFSHNSSTVNNAHTCALDLGLTCFENVGHIPLVNDVYYRLEACIRRSSTLTSQNGILWWAINGTMVGRYTNFNYQGVNEFVWNQTWDGYGNGQGFDGLTEQILDHIVIAIPPSGGCASIAGGGTPTPPSPTPPGPTPPPTPPTPPTGIGVVNDLVLSAIDSTTLRVSFTQVTDGAGGVPKYDVRFAPAPMQWGASPNATNGTCSNATILNGAVGSQVSCTITNVNPNTTYNAQLVPYVGIIGSATYGQLSNIGAVTTPSSGSGIPPVPTGLKVE